MAESSRNSAVSPDPDRKQRFRDSPASATGSPPRPGRQDAEPFVVGFGDCAGIVDRIEAVESGPAQVVDRSLVGYRFPQAVAKLRDRAASQKTGESLPVRLDRRLLLPANTQRRQLLEEDIRAMHGMELHDGRMLQVDEVLGRYGDPLGGTGEQLIEIGHRLAQGEQVRLAVNPAGPSDETYRQLGALRHKYGHQLSFYVAGRPSEQNAFRRRLARETVGARITMARDQLLAGHEVVLAIESAALADEHRRDLSALRRQFGDRLKMPVDQSVRQPQADAAVLPLQTSRADVPSHTAEPTEPPIFEAVVPAGHDTRSDWAREVAARVRRPWWQRTRWYQKLVGDQKTGA